MRVEGKVALITGAAAGVEGRLKGLGGTAANLLAREGASVVLTDLNDELGEQTASAIRAAGGKATYMRLDVTDEAAWQDAIDRTVDLYGRLDVLVHSAGVTFRTTVEETSEELWDLQMDVHVKGAFFGTKHAIPEMRNAGGGSIVLISSLAGLVGSASSTGYHAAKGAMRLFAKTAAVQYARENIRVNSVHPGFVLTPMFEPLMHDPGPGGGAVGEGADGTARQAGGDRQCHPVPCIGRVVLHHRGGAGRGRGIHGAVGVTAPFGRRRRDQRGGAEAYRRLD